MGKVYAVFQFSASNNSVENASGQPFVTGLILLIEGKLKQEGKLKHENNQCLECVK